MMICYFAYGSNMLPLRLQKRCASARLDRMATLPGYELSFSKIGKDGSGKATLVPSTHPEATVHGVVFHLAPDDMPVLDRIESTGKGYERLENVTVFSQPDLQPLTVTTYIAENNYRDETLQPFDWYLALVLKGAACAGLPQDYCRRLEAIPAWTDPDPKSMTRQAALEILAEAGVFL